MILHNHVCAKNIAFPWMFGALHRLTIIIFMMVSITAVRMRYLSRLDILLRRRIWGELSVIILSVLYVLISVQSWRKRKRRKKRDGRRKSKSRERKKRR